MNRQVVVTPGGWPLSATPPGTTGFVAPAGPAIAVTVRWVALMVAAVAAVAAPFSVRLVPLKPKPMASRWDR
jgi:hypothetical protein